MTDNIKSESFLSSSEQNDEIDIGKLFRFLLMQSKLIISIVLAAFILSFFFYSQATKLYSIKSLIQYEAFNQNIFNPSESLQFSPGTASSSDISNMVKLYESRTNYLKVIKDLNLNIDVKDLDDDESIDINIISDESDLLIFHKFKLSFSNDRYSLLDQDLNEIQSSKYGQEIPYKDLKISVKSVKLKDYRPLDISFRNPESIYNSFKNAMNVSTSQSRNAFFKNEGLIDVSYTTDDTVQGKEIINYANKIFLNQRIYDENEKSRKAIRFIEENIRSIEDSVAINKTKLKEFREENKSIDVSLEIEAIVNKIQSLDKALSSIDIELAKAEEIYTLSNPAYLNLTNEKKLIELQKEKVLSEIEMMPKEQQEYIDLFNELEISQALFEELESRRLGFSILEASTIGDVRVIDEAYVDSQVSPRIIIVVVATVLALVLACLLAVIRGLYFLPISNPAEIFDNSINLPIIGVIPDINEFKEGTTDNIKLNTSIESLIVNINSIQNNQHDKNIITITSPSAGNGKSTISMKLAEGFAKIGKKVLLVDNDLKRGNLGRNYDRRSISENTFNAINEESIDKYMLQENLYLIPRVKGLSNTFQFLYSYQYSEKIKFFKAYFDIIIFDTGPILAVADSSILIEKSDFNILVARHGINKINEVKQCIENYKQISKSIDGLVYNAYAKPQGYYGYYSLYGNYSYQYYADRYLEDAYEYEKKD